MPVDDAKIRDLKTRRGIFLAHGAHEKVKAMDVEIARLRGDLPPDPAKQPRAAVPTPEPDPEPTPVVETAEADLTGVETAAIRRGPGRPRRV